ncbi:ABC transporter ATP-binding protein [Ureibacillus sp. NPDC094379]
MHSTNLLEVKNLKTSFHTEEGNVSAIDVSFQIKKGEILGIVGESGCGKSVTAQSILRLLDEKAVNYEGEVLLNDVNLLSLSKKKMQKIRGNDISMVFQDPLSSLNPAYTIGNQIIETIRAHKKVSKKEAIEKSIELLRLVGIPAPEARLYDYPHQLSGGMRQRVMIAIALACEPKLLIADEPTTALDVTIQAQIMELFLDINKKLDMSIMLITHDLGVVAEVCDRVIVMYLGQIIEEATVKELFTNPKHPYTKGLIQSIPHLDGDRLKDLQVIDGSVPTFTNIPNGCRFSNRCEFATHQCKTEVPLLIDINNKMTKVRCWYVEETVGLEV